MSGGVAPARDRNATEPEAPMWGELIRDSLLRPRAAARRVLAFGLPIDVLAMALVAVTATGMVIAYIAARLTGGGLDAMTVAILRAPLMGAVLQLAIMGTIAVGTARIGRMFGGSGRTAGALSLVVWLNVLLLLAQVAQIVALVFLPPLAFILAIATLLWLLWAFASFVAEFHGFSNLVAVLAGVVVSMVIFFLALASLLAALGFVPQGLG
jgi:hypothetical protein